MLKNKNILVIFITMLALATLVFWRLGEATIFQVAQNYVFDTYQRIKPRREVAAPIRIIDIDVESLSKEGQWPWPRARVAQMIDRLHEMGALVIAMDMIFAEPDRTSPNELIRQLNDLNWKNLDQIEPALEQLPDNDAILSRSIEKAPVVLGFFFSPPTNDGVNVIPEHKGGFANLGGDPTPHLWEFHNSQVSLPDFIEAAKTNANANPAPGNRDDVIRSIAAFVNGNGNVYGALSVEALRIAHPRPTTIIKSLQDNDTKSITLKSARIGSYSIPLTPKGEFNVYYAKHSKDKFLSAYKLLADDYKNLETLVKDQIILVGTSAEGLEDIRLTTLGENIPGVAIHAQVIEQILTEEFLKRPIWTVWAEILLTILSIIVISIFMVFSGAFVSAAIGGVLILTILATSWWSFSSHSLLIDPFFPAVSVLTIFLLSTVLRFAITEREKRFVRSAFQHYLAPDLLNKLEDNPNSLKLGGEIRDMSLMFMDIRGFTPISEKLSPEELVDFLNELLSPLSQIILKNDGAIDKYIGDCIMAFWNAPLDVADHRKKSALAALEMIEKVKKLNDQDAFDFKSDKYRLGNVEIGIGINSGDGCVGNLGSSNRFDYSVVGDTVNIAARIESACKEIGWHILLSEETANECSDLALLEAGKIPLKGKSEPIAIYALIGNEEVAQSDNFVKLRQKHDELLEITDLSEGMSQQAIIDAKIQECIALADDNLLDFYNKFRSRQESE